MVLWLISGVFLTAAVMTGLSLSWPWGSLLFPLNLLLTTLVVGQSVRLIWRVRGISI